MWLRHKARTSPVALKTEYAVKPGQTLRLVFMPLPTSRRNFIAILQNLINLPRVMRITSRAVHDVCASAVVSGII